MEIRPTAKGDEFLLTDRGEHAVEEMEGPDFEEIIRVCFISVEKGLDSQREAIVAMLR